MGLNLAPIDQEIIMSEFIIFVLCEAIEYCNIGHNIY